jgi:hypothetical protein
LPCSNVFVPTAHALVHLLLGLMTLLCQMLLFFLYYSVQSAIHSNFFKLFGLLELFRKLDSSSGNSTESDQQISLPVLFVQLFGDIAFLKTEIFFNSSICCWFVQRHDVHFHALVAAVATAVAAHPTAR